MLEQENIAYFFARQGFDVVAVELVEKHVKQIKEKINEEMSIEVIQGNALDLSIIEDKSYDIVLCFGPLYHLSKMEDRMKCISEVKRVCKDNGKCSLLLFPMIWLLQLKPFYIILIFFT